MTIVENDNQQVIQPNVIATAIVFSLYLSVLNYCHGNDKIINMLIKYYITAAATRFTNDYSRK